MVRTKKCEDLALSRFVAWFHTFKKTMSAIRSSAVSRRGSVKVEARRTVAKPSKVVKSSTPDSLFYGELPCHVSLLCASTVGLIARLILHALGDDPSVPSRIADSHSLNVASSLPSQEPTAPSSSEDSLVSSRS